AGEGVEVGLVADGVVVQFAGPAHLLEIDVVLADDLGPQFLVPAAGRGEGLLGGRGGAVLLAALPLGGGQLPPWPLAPRRQTQQPNGQPGEALPCGGLLLLELLVGGPLVRLAGLLAGDPLARRRQGQFLLADGAVQFGEPLLEAAQLALVVVGP